MDETSTDYTITQKIHETKHSVVYRGVRDSDSKLVVIKMLRKEISTLNHLAALERDYEVTSRLTQQIPHAVVNVIEKKYVGDRPMIVSEDLQATSLDRLIPESGFPLARFFHFATQIAKLMQDIHSCQVIHRDIKPSNIVVVQATNELRIIDFGISAIVSLKNPTISTAAAASSNTGYRMQGTLNYLSPEQTGRSNNSIDFRSDLYSVGVTFFMMLSGALPFETSDPLEIVHFHLAKKPPLVSTRAASKIPPHVDQIIDKLLAKNPDDRYQSATSLHRDLVVCQQQIQEKGYVDSSFVIGLEDKRIGFALSDKLYGRDEQLQQLFRIFTETITNHSASMVVVRGVPGVGKSALVSELYKRAQASGSSPKFIVGKFDKFKQDIPYSAIIDCIRSLVNQLLMREDMLEKYLIKFKVILDTTDIRLLRRLVPEMEMLLELSKAIGTSTIAKMLTASEAEDLEIELSLEDTSVKTGIALIKFMKIVAVGDESILLFLDDLQWCDAASLKLLSLFLAARNLNLMTVVAYREDEMPISHPAMQTLHELTMKYRVSTISLGNLEYKDLNMLVADSLKVDSKTTLDLTSAITAKTSGNPFFSREFLLMLYQEGYITVNSTNDGWTWSKQKIERLEASENVISLMVHNLVKLEPKLLNVLKHASCAGSIFSLKLVCAALNLPPEAVQPYIFEGIKSGLFTEYLLDISKNTTHQYVFYHDRIQAGAYMLLSSEEKERIHARIGLNLLASSSTSLEDLSHKDLFDIVNQLNYGSRFIGKEKQELLITLNLVAARRAAETFAFEPMMNYAQATISMLPEPDCWNSSTYETTFEAYMLAGEGSKILGKLEVSRKYFKKLVANANSRLRQTKVAVQYLRLLCNLGDFREATELCFNTVLRKYGILKEIKLEDEQGQNLEIFAETKAEIDKMLTGTTFEEIVQMKEDSSEENIAMVQLCVECMPVIFMSDYPKSLLAIASSAAVKLALEQGLTPYSSCAFVIYGWALASFLQDYEASYLWGQLGHNIVHSRFSKNKEAKSITQLCHNLTHIWGSSFDQTIQTLDESIKLLRQIGNYSWATYAASHLIQHLIYMGVPVSTAIAKLDEIVPMLNSAKFDTFIPLFKDIYGGYFLCLKGQTSSNSFSTHGTEQQLEERVFQTKNAHNICIYYMLKAIVNYYLGNSKLCTEFMTKADILVETIHGLSMYYFWSFFKGLCLTLSVEVASTPEERVEYINQLKICVEHLQKFANTNPAIFKAQYLLVNAEYQRITQQTADLKFLSVYEEAIQTAVSAKSFDNVTAVACELAAKYCITNELSDRLAKDFMRDSKDYFARAELKRKVKSIKQKYQRFFFNETAGMNDSSDSTDSSYSSTGSSSSISTRSQSSAPGNYFSSLKSSMDTTSSALSLDTLTIIKTSQALSSKIEFDKLATDFMKIMIETVGADKGCLILSERYSLGNPIPKPTKHVKHGIHAEHLLGPSPASTVPSPNLLSPPGSSKHGTPSSVITPVSSPGDFEMSLYSVRAEVNVNTGTKSLHMPIPAYENASRPIIKSVISTKRMLLLDNAALNNMYGADPYIQKNKVKSLLCAPIKRKNDTIGVVYLENNSVIGAFSQNRMYIITVLLSQLAISIENAVLYTNMKLLNQAYERFLPKEFLNQLQKGEVTDIALGDCIQKDMTILFSDMRSFTSITENMTPEESFAFINKYLRRVGPVIRANKGFIDKFIGDAVMALFPESADDAVIGALAIQQAMKEYNDELTLQKEKYRVHLGIGLNTGSVMLGTIGEAARMEATVISDSVNLASRLESLTKTFGCQILITQYTLNALKNKEAYHHRCLGTFRVSGKHEKVDIFEVFTEQTEETQNVKLLFGQGLEYFKHGKFTEAAGIFSKLPRDKASMFYFKSCKTIMQSGIALSSSWAGELALDKEGNLQVDFL